MRFSTGQNPGSSRFTGYHWTQVLQMLSTNHLAVGQSVIEIMTCNERLLEHAKAYGAVKGHGFSHRSTASIIW